MSSLKIIGAAGAALLAAAICSPAQAQAGEQKPGAELGGHAMEVRYENGYWTRTTFETDGTYRIWSRSDLYSYGKWWVDAGQLCFLNYLNGKACWKYRPMKEGVSYPTETPEGRKAVARLYTVKP